MTQNITTSAIENFFEENGVYVDTINCKGGRVAFDTSDWHSFEDFQKAANEYNEQAGEEVLHVGIIVETAGNSTPSVYENNLYAPVDAFKDAWMIYGDTDRNDVHVVAFEDIDNELEALKEGEENTEELEAEFASIRKEMSADEVLVYNGSIMNGYYSIDARHPMGWTNDTKSYKVCLVVGCL